MNPGYKFAGALTISPTGDLTDDEVTYVLQFFDKNTDYCYCLETGPKSGDLHMHMAYLVKVDNWKTLSKFAETFRTHMSGLDSERFKVSGGKWSKNKMWHKGGSEGGEQTWMEYLTKDGPVTKSKYFPDNYEDYCYDNIPLDKRRPKTAAWAIMGKYENLFTEHKLPYESLEDVMNGISSLAYTLRVVQPPRQSDRRGFVMDLFNYLHKSGNAVTCYEDWGLEVSVQRELKRKRWVIEDKKYDDIINNVN